MTNEQTRHPVDQTPLGELLYNARAAKDWSRKKLADECNKYEKTISSNSIVRYEKAGSDDPDGQYPTSPKLAILCKVLDISPSQGLWSCLSQENFEYAGAISTDVVQDHPMVNYLTSQYEKLVKDNYLMRQALNLFVNSDTASNSEFEFPYDQEELDWFKDQIKKIISRNEDFTSRMIMLGGVSMQVHRITTHPSNIKERRWKYDVSKYGTLNSDDLNSKSPVLRDVYEELKTVVNKLEDIFENKKNSGSLQTSPSSQDDE